MNLKARRQVRDLWPELMDNWAMHDVKASIEESVSILKSRLRNEKKEDMIFGFWLLCLISVKRDCSRREQAEVGSIGSDGGGERDGGWHWRETTVKPSIVSESFPHPILQQSIFFWSTLHDMPFFIPSASSSRHRLMTPCHDGCNFRRSSGFFLKIQWPPAVILIFPQFR